MAYLPLSTANLPDPVINPAQGASPEDYFNTVLYTGDGNSSHAITGVGFQPDWLWIKSRSAAYNHNVWDVVRGASQRLLTNATDAEETQTGDHKSFDSDGFTVGVGNIVNQSGQTYVAWNWKANGSGVTNTDGSIPSTVSANTTSGFSIVSYTGNATAGATVGHGLNSAPEMVIVKDRDAATNWGVGHIGINGGSNPWDYKLHLDLTNAQSDDVNVWNDTAPTSSVVTLGAGGIPNGNTVAYIMYCFHSVEGFSKFGSYVGNGSADGPFVYTGFRPAFVMMKRTDSTQDWAIFDNKRNPSNAQNNLLRANLSDAEAQGNDIDCLSNGFKPRTTALRNNASGGTYIYMAFSANPFKFSTAF